MTRHAGQRGIGVPPPTLRILRAADAAARMSCRLRARVMPDTHIHLERAEEREGAHEDDHGAAGAR